MLFAVAVFAPLLGSIIAGLFGRAIGDKAAQAVTILCMLLAAICGVSAFVSLVYGGAQPGTVLLADWLEAGTFHVSWALRYDALAAVMVAMVTVVATLIHIYSVGYMSHERTSWRFFSYLSLFTFSMLMLVTADNLVQLFFGWEGVGLASYLLIGYWYDRPRACAAAIKAMIVNRIGDLSFAVGIALVFMTFGSVEFSAIFAAVPQHMNDTYSLFGTWPAYEVIGILLFIGRDGQIGADRPACVAAGCDGGADARLRADPCGDDGDGGRVPDVALLAGAELRARRDGLYHGDRRHHGAVRGDGRLCAERHQAGDRLFHLFAARLHVRGRGRGRVPGVDVPSADACLLQGAAVPGRGLRDPCDVRRAGSAQDGRLAKMVPITCTVMWIGSLALAGIPPFSGYFSKDAILEAAWAGNTASAHYGFWCGTIAAFLTAFYSWRLLIMAFHGKSRADRHTLEHVHESPAVMTVPLLLLSVGAVFAGWAFRDQLIGDQWRSFWGNAIQIAPTNHVLANMELIPGIISVLPTVLGVLGIALAYVMYVAVPTLPAQLAAQFGGIYRFLLNKWYFDELYDAVDRQAAARAVAPAMAGG